MKIAMTHVDLPGEARGGVAFQAHYLANTLAARGHEVTMFTFSPAPDECRYRVHRYPLAGRWRRWQSFALAYRLAQTDFRDFDVLHTHGDNFLLAGRHPQVRTFYGSALDEARSAVTLRRKLMQRLMARLEQRGAQAADLNVGISEATRRRIPAVSVLIPCGVDLARFRPGSKAGHPVVLFVGTTGGRKRGRFLADCFLREVRPRLPDAELWSVAEAPLEGAGIVNHGRVPVETLADLFRRAWVFCLPSTYEGFGVPYIEALASGTPVVASPNPGAREVLCEGAFGEIADDGTLGPTLIGLLEDSTRRAALAARGRERAQRYDWDRIAARYEAVYADAMARCGKRSCA